MALLRENILGLIGSRRYHSAIMTTFSFDFFFFEMKAMKWLRSCGIRNVNVLIDGHYYAELMQQLGGEEMKLSPGYSLYPVFNKSIFHPKIWMLFGEKEALLIIGSGNLTNAGNGNNEEIWGAYHYDIRVTDNAAIFSTAWNYVQQICASVKGFTHEKTTRWIIDHAKWLNELPKPTPALLNATAGKEKVAFLSNTATTTIWQQLSTLIAKEKIIDITMLSPFYDKNGKAIQALSNLFPSAKLNIVIDKCGLVPEDLPASKVYSFYDWYDIGISKPLHSKAENGAGSSKLHAKIIHFKTASGKEYCLFGSANVTPEGLGLSGTTPNTEVSLLIESVEGGLLNRIGVKLKSSLKLSEFVAENNTSIYESIIKHNRNKVRLLSAELVYDELYLYAEGEYPNKLTAKLYDNENRLLHTIKMGVFSMEMKAKPATSLQGVHHLELHDETNDSPVSNKILLSDHFILAKTHPNPKSEDIERIYNDIQGGELTKVLDLLHYAILDETEWADSSNVLANKSSQAIKSAEKHGPDKLYDLSTYKPVENHSLEKGLLLSSMSLRVLDVLKFIRSKDFVASTQSELRVDEQEDDLGNTTGVDEKEITIVRNISLALLKSERKKLLAYFDNLSDHQQLLLYSNDKPKEYKPTLTDLIKYLIALELMLEFGGKSEKYVEEDKEHFFTYLNYNGEEPYYNDSVKGCSLNIIGDFLILVRSGFKDYEFEYTKNKILQLSSEALTATIVCIMNNRWKESEEHYVKTMILNCLHYLSDRNPEKFNTMLPALRKGIAEKIESLKYPSNMLKENLNWFEKKIIPAYLRTIRQLQAKDFDTIAEKGQLIYKSPWGYCLVKDVSKQNEFTLIRPGFLWDDKLGDFIMHSNDEVYHPITLNSFILVKI